MEWNEDEIEHDFVAEISRGPPYLFLVIPRAVNIETGRVDKYESLLRILTKQQQVEIELKPTLPAICADGPAARG